MTLDQRFEWRYLATDLPIVLNPSKNMALMIDYDLGIGWRSGVIIFSSERPVDHGDTKRATPSTRRLSVFLKRSDKKLWVESSDVDGDSPKSSETSAHWDIPRQGKLWFCFDWYEDEFIVGHGESLGDNEILTCKMSDLGLLDPQYYFAQMVASTANDWEHGNLTDGHWSNPIIFTRLPIVLRHYMDAVEEEDILDDPVRPWHVLLLAQLTVLMLGLFFL